jgi:hypothetical protein
MAWYVYLKPLEVILFYVTLVALTRRAIYPLLFLRREMSVTCHLSRSFTRRALHPSENGSGGWWMGATLNRHTSGVGCSGIHLGGCEVGKSRLTTRILSIYWSFCPLPTAQSLKKVSRTYFKQLSMSIFWLQP